METLLNCRYATGSGAEEVAGVEISMDTADGDGETRLDREMETLAPKPGRLALAKIPFVVYIVKGH